MCSVGQSIEALPFIQLNFKKSLLASVEFAKRVGKMKGFICLASEPYIAYDSALVGGNNLNEMTSKMQKVTDKLTRWGRTCGLKFNASKTVAVLFTRKKALPQSTLRVDGSVIPFSPSITYLGVELDRKLNWKIHIQSKIDKAKGICSN